MKKAKVVIGAGFGDEGKGLFTDYLSSKTDNSLVVRFNGGAQAGHTVVTPYGQRHVFGHFCSNSFLPNARGYLSRYFIINPLIFLKELKQLNEMGLHPVIACHDEAYLTTPYDMIINQWLEESRGSAKHGSCGLGIGETIHRSEVGHKTLQIKDTYSIPRLRDKLIIIRAFFERRIDELGLNDFLKENSFILNESVIDRYIDDVKEMNRTLILGVNDFYQDYFKGYDIIFEGAQGLMLDQTMGYFPHVTRSNTGLKNVIELCIQNEIKDLEVIYATRCYKTRHGAGFLNHELKEKPYERIVDLTNIHNKYQDSLRFAYLDLDDLYLFIQKDLDMVKEDIQKHDIKLNKTIGISCLDQTDNVKYYLNGSLYQIKNTNFKDIFNINNFRIKESYGCTRENVI